MKLLAYVSPEFVEEPVQYVLRFWSSCLGQQILNVKKDDVFYGNAIVFTYSADVPDFLKQQSETTLLIHIKPSSFFRKEFYLKRNSLPVEVRYFGQLPYLLFPGDQTLNEKQFPDVFANTFFLLTCYEDLIDCGTRDRRQRKEFKSSVLAKLNVLNRPVVDLWIEYFRDYINKNFAGSLKKQTWGGHPFAFVITRDIDSLSKFKPFTFRGFFGSLLDGNIVRYFYTIRSPLNNRPDPYDNLEQIFDWEQVNNYRSSVYFLASDEAGDADYNLDNLAKKPVIKKMVNNGWEVGFHPGAYAYQDRERFKMEKNKLEKVLSVEIKGGRQHGLRFSNPHTWRLWEENGLQYDSTVGFAEHEGFRAGTCKPYFVFDLLENRETDLIEIPLTLMDCTLDKYRKLDEHAMRNVCLNLLDEVKNVNGVFVLLWHNTYFGKENINGYHDILLELIKTAKSKNAFMTTAFEINRLIRLYLKRAYNEVD